MNHSIYSVLGVVVWWWCTSFLPVNYWLLHITGHWPGPLSLQRKMLVDIIYIFPHILLLYCLYCPPQFSQDTEKLKYVYLVVIHILCKIRLWLLLDLNLKIFFSMSTKMKLFTPLSIIISPVSKSKHNHLLAYIWITPYTRTQNLLLSYCTNNL